MAKTKTKTATKQTKKPAAKKTTAAKQTKKPTAKKTTARTKGTQTATKKPAVKTKTVTAKKPTAKKAARGSFDSMISGINSMANAFKTLEDVSTALTPLERRRLQSAGVRIYGFIDKAFDIARDNPQFMPANFDIAELNDKLRKLEEYRQFMLVIQKLLQLVTDAFMIHSNDCYQDALSIYRSLQGQARSRVPGAAPLLAALAPFFHRTRHTQSETPTKKQELKNVKALLDGRADGEIIIENISPKIVGGKHKVIDTVRRGKTSFKETEDFSEKE